MLTCNIAYRVIGKVLFVIKRCKTMNNEDKEISKTICVLKIDRYTEEIFDARMEKYKRKKE